jgi:hypothetical protein
MRIAKLVLDGPRIEDETERARIAGFLRGGKVIVRVPGSGVDKVAPANGQVVPMSTLTDGTWIWGAALRYYVEIHGIAPEPEFLTHITEHAYVAPRLDETACRAALDQLR